MLVGVTELTLVDPLVKDVVAKVTPEETVAIWCPLDVDIVIVIDPVSLILFGVIIELNMIKLVVVAATEVVDPDTFTTDDVFVVKLVPLTKMPFPVYEVKLELTVISLGNVNSITEFASTGNGKE